MSDSDSSLDSELLAVAGKKASGKKRGRKALSSDEEEVSSEEVSLEDESDWEDAPRCVAASADCPPPSAASLSTAACLSQLRRKPSQL